MNVKGRLFMPSEPATTPGGRGDVPAGVAAAVPVAPVAPVVDGVVEVLDEVLLEDEDEDEDDAVPDCAGGVVAAPAAPPTVSERKSMPALRAADSSWKTSDAASSSSGTALPRRAAVA